jgi:hypothetical protein
MPYGPCMRGSRHVPAVQSITSAQRVCAAHARFHQSGLAVADCVRSARRCGSAPRRPGANAAAGDAVGAARRVLVELARRRQALVPQRAGDDRIADGFPRAAPERPAPAGAHGGRAPARRVRRLAQRRDRALVAERRVAAQTGILCCSRRRQHERGHCNGDSPSHGIPPFCVAEIGRCAAEWQAFPGNGSVSPRDRRCRSRCAGAGDRCGGVVWRDQTLV